MLTNPSDTICPLCQKNTPLIKSHIIPEFMYKGIYDASGKYLALAGQLTDSRVSGHSFFGTKGANEGMLCKDCDNNVIGSRIEEPAKSIIEKIRGLSSSPPLQLMKVDYKLFKLFQLSILWRVSLSNNPLFKKAALPEKHISRMRDMLVAEDPGPYYQYGCIMFTFPKDNVLNRTMVDTRSGRWNGHTIIHVSSPGLRFLFVVSSHTKQFAQKVGFLQEDGTLPIAVAPREVVESELSELAFIVKNTPPNS
ncbi:MAG: hypothetical protein EPO32_12575 [Anaerolineae bacterium]|nr:MAG: hypothetical protein EPO32_12575 [Anaerolineae bacterium]